MSIAIPPTLNPPLSPTPDGRRQSPDAPPTAPCWYRPSGADLLFLILSLIIFSTARQGLLDDPGLGWHLRNIDAMLARGGWLTEDPFSQPRDGPPRAWYSNQWLGEIPLWLGERWAGREGIAAVAALVIAFTLRCLYRMLVSDGAPWPVAVFWTSQAAMGSSCSWVARPNLFTLLFVLVTARVCVLFHEGRCSRCRALWLLPLFALWANVHGGFVAGFALLGVTSLTETLIAVFSGGGERAQAARGRAIFLLLLSGGAFLATLLNPYGLALYRWVFQLLGDPFFMDLHQEWKSPDFHGKGAMRFEWLMLLFPLLLALSKRRPTLVELALALSWFHLALTGFRYVPLWVVVVTPLLARSSLHVPALQDAASRLLSSGQGGSLFQTGRGPASWVWSLAAALFLLGLARGAEGRLARHQPEILPEAGLDRLLAIQAERERTQGRPPVVFHSYDWGGYLTWHGGPDFRNWIDDRNEVQGRQRIEEYFSILGTDPGWEEKLDRAGVDLVGMQPNAPLTFRLAERRSWQERYRDRWVVIFERVPIR